MVCEFYLNKFFLKSKLLWTSPLNFAFNDIMLVRIGLPDLASKNTGNGEIWISDKQQICFPPIIFQYFKKKLWNISL